LRCIGWLLFGSAFTATFAAVGCRNEHSGEHPDGGQDGAVTDGPVLRTLDMAISGCPTYDPETRVCSGPAPLTISFAPVGSPDLTRFKWTFGDGTPSVTERTPTHTYTLPGTYEVRVDGLVGEPDVGIVPSPRGSILVVPVAIGGLCDLDAQCGTGPTCTCTPGSGCADAFLRGLCAFPCPYGSCLGGTCVTLAMAGSSGAVTRSPFCLAACDDDRDCALGLVCSTLPSGGPLTRWHRVCLPRGAVTRPGGSCRDANGNLDGYSCATGSCADIGTLGLCTADCASDFPCPDDMTCALLTDGRHLCLPACGGAPNACATDPLLACQPPAPDGGSGFSAEGAAEGVSYCAPRSCTRDDECSPGGRCGTDAVCVSG
jgi:hypothetical protein